MMRWVLLVFTLVFSFSVTSEAQAPMPSQAELKRSCKKFLALSPTKQTAIAKKSKKYTRKQMLWACGIILTRNDDGGAGSGSGNHETRPTRRPEPSWQCRAEGEVGRRRLTGSGTGSTKSAAESYARSRCGFGGSCHVTSCSSRKFGTTETWTCWAEGYSMSRKERFNGRTEKDRSSAERSAISECSWKAKDCRIDSCSSR